MADKKPAAEEPVRPIFIKKVIKKGGGHHGGAWKVAYADFVTAMMAFFLLLWLLNVTTDEQKEGIADFFNPNPRITESVSGAGGLLGGLTISPEGAQSANASPVTPPNTPLDPALRPGDDALQAKPTPEQLSQERLAEEQRKAEEAEFQKAEDSIKQAIQDSPELAELSKNLMVDMTPEGLRIQIVDQEGNSMFPSGSAQMYDKTKLLMEKVANVIEKMPNQVSIRGHTDSVPLNANGYTNWELSTDRANASRKVMVQSGLPESRINNVLGKADTDHIINDKPNDPKNRRISIILLRDSIVTQEGAGKSSEATRRKNAVTPSLFKRSQGTVEFP